MPVNYLAMQEHARKIITALCKSHYSSSYISARDTLMATFSKVS